MMRYGRINILGVGISGINLEQTLTSFEAWIAGREQHYVCLAAAHTLMSCQVDPELRDVFNASGLTTPDGMAIVWLLKLRGQRGADRVYGPDLLQLTSRRSVNKGWRHFFYGGETGVPEALKSVLEREHPGIQIVGTYSPPFRPLSAQEDLEIVAQINAVQPDIIWVGTGTSKQERWMRDHLGKVDAPVLVGVGAAFDFISGHKPQAPRWMQRTGFEWLFRLITEPGRLWRRYAQYPLFVVLVLAQLLGLKRYPEIPAAAHAEDRQEI